MAEPTSETPRQALLKSAEVCEIIKVQPYVLRSWEKEFPDLGTTRTTGGPRFYRPSDVERVQRLKQLIFGEGLTIAGARRRLDEERGAPLDDELPFDDPPARGVSADTRERLEGVRRGLRGLLEMLSTPAPPPRANGQPMTAPPPVKSVPSRRRSAPKRRRPEAAVSE